MQVISIPYDYLYFGTQLGIEVCKRKNDIPRQGVVIMSWLEAINPETATGQAKQLLDGG